MNMKKSTYFLGSIILLLCILAWIQTNEITPPAHIYPRAILGITAGLTLLMLFRTIQGKSPDFLKKPFEHARLVQIFIVIALTGLFILGMQFLGFYVSTFLYIVAGVLYLEEHINKHSILSAIILSVVVDAIVYLAFNVFLSVPTPVGLLI
ncbi:tripartite tricarboxylate transporter TctB family protein [Peptococcus simiae]|uniref:tripartite tricarboxylate transporter TctB family protein n=1 Tax=Peptococcus simiae TaxID=1643805 RepID=UPI0039806D00